MLGHHTMEMNEVDSSMDIGACDLLIVASSTDPLANALADVCARAGYSARISDLETAARFFSITVENGVAAVEPDLPIFHRMPPPKDLRNSFDEAFSHGECFAHFFAVASLIKSTIINRPFKGSLSGKVVQSTAVTELRTGEPLVATEIFSSIMPQAHAESTGRSLYVQDLGTYETMEARSLPTGVGPYRAKWSDHAPAYEMVTVLGQEAWRSTKVKLDHLMLESRSIKLLDQLKLVFGVVTWAISPSLENAVITRVDPYPSLNQVGMVWPELSKAFLKVLFK
jgi:hypothetical protein